MAPYNMSNDELVEHTLSIDTALSADSDDRAVNHLDNVEDTMKNTELANPRPTEKPKKAINSNSGDGSAPFKLRAPAFSQCELDGMLATYKSKFGDDSLTIPDSQLAGSPEEATVSDTCADTVFSGSDDQSQVTSVATSFDTVATSCPGSFSFQVIDEDKRISEKVFGKAAHMQSTAAVEQTTAGIGFQFDMGGAAVEEEENSQGASKDHDIALAKRSTTTRKTMAGGKTSAGVRKKEIRKTPTNKRKTTARKALPTSRRITARKSPATVTKPAETAAVTADKEDEQQVQIQAQQGAASDAESEIEYTPETAIEASEIWTARIARLNRERSRHQNPATASHLHQLVRALQANRLKALDSVDLEVDEEITKREDVWDRVRRHNDSIKKLWKATERERRVDARVREATYERIDAEILERQEMLESIGEEDADLLLMGFVPATKRRAGKTIIPTAALPTSVETPASEASELAVSEIAVAYDDKAEKNIVDGNTDSLLVDGSHGNQGDGDEMMAGLACTDPLIATNSKETGNVTTTSARKEDICDNDHDQSPSDHAVESPRSVEPVVIESQNSEIIATTDSSSTEEVVQAQAQQASEPQVSGVIAMTDVSQDFVLAIEDYTTAAQTQGAQCVDDFLFDPHITEAEMYANIALREAFTRAGEPLWYSSVIESRSDNDLGAYPFSTEGNFISGDAIASVKNSIAGQKEEIAETSTGVDSAHVREQMFHEFEEAYLEDYDDAPQLDGATRMEVGKLPHEKIATLGEDFLSWEPPAWATETYDEMLLFAPCLMDDADDFHLDAALEAEMHHFQLLGTQNTLDTLVEQKSSTHITVPSEEAVHQNVSVPALLAPDQPTTQEEIQGSTALTTEVSIQRDEEDQNEPPEQLEASLSKHSDHPPEEEFSVLIALGEQMRKEDEDLQAVATAKEQQQASPNQNNDFKQSTVGTEQTWQHNFHGQQQREVSCAPSLESEQLLMNEADQFSVLELGTSADEAQMQMYTQLQCFAQWDQMPQGFQIHDTQQDFQYHRTPVPPAQQNVQSGLEFRLAQQYQLQEHLMQRAPIQAQPYQQYQVAPASATPMTMIAPTASQRQSRTSSLNTLQPAANILPKQQRRYVSSQSRRASRRKASGNNSHASLAPMKPMVPIDYAEYQLLSQQARTQARQAAIDSSGSSEQPKQSWELIDQEQMKTGPPLYPHQVRVLSDMSEHFHSRHRQISEEIKAAGGTRRTIESRRPDKGDQQPQDTKFVEQPDRHEQVQEYTQAQTYEQSQPCLQQGAYQPPGTPRGEHFLHPPQACQQVQVDHSGQYVDHSQAFRGIQQDQLEGLSPTSQIMRITGVWELTKPAVTTPFRPTPTNTSQQPPSPATQTPKKAAPKKRSPRGPYRKSTTTPSSPPTDNEGNPIKRRPGRPCKKDGENTYKRSRFAKTLVEDAEHTQPTSVGKRKPARGRKAAAAQTPNSCANGSSSEVGQQHVQYQANPNAALGLNVSAEAYVAKSMQQKAAASRARKASQAMQAVQKMQQGTQTPRVTLRSPAPTPRPHRAIAPKTPVSQHGNIQEDQAPFFVQGQAGNPSEGLCTPIGNGAQSPVVATQTATLMAQNVNRMAHQGYVQPQNFQQDMARAYEPVKNISQKPTTMMQPAAASRTALSPDPVRKVHGDVTRQTFVQPHSDEVKISVQYLVPSPRQNSLPCSTQAQKARQQRQQLQIMGSPTPAMRSGSAQRDTTYHKRRPDEPQQLSPDVSKRQNTGLVQTPSQQIMGTVMSVQPYHLSPMPQYQTLPQGTRSRQILRPAEPRSMMGNMQSGIDVSVDDGINVEGEIERLEQANVMLQSKIQDNNQEMRRLRQNGLSQTREYQDLLQQNASSKSQMVQNDNGLEQLQYMLRSSAYMDTATPQYGQMPSVDLGFLPTTFQHLPINQPVYQGQDLIPVGEVDDNNNNNNNNNNIVYVGMDTEHKELSSQVADEFGNGH